MRSAAGKNATDSFCIVLRMVQWNNSGCDHNTTARAFSLDKIRKPCVQNHNPTAAGNCNLKLPILKIMQNSFNICLSVSMVKPLMENS